MVGKVVLGNFLFRALKIICQGIIIIEKFVKMCDKQKGFICLVFSKFLLSASVKCFKTFQQKLPFRNKNFKGVAHDFYQQKMFLRAWRTEIFTQFYYFVLFVKQ
eukprot:TRINITY_DN2147_c0_g1_i1.p3 TRINITY_DN2147_c0_g1~~TRINITY_DN2147_c0_g1_i1.p3  ORF type:complete len:104 (-),score=0.83 TRINITY_DN2147_c0_g1_i1:85-396(-)